MPEVQVTLTLSVPRSLKEQIEQQASAERRSVSNYVRVVLEEIMEKKESARAHEEVGA